MKVSLRLLPLLLTVLATACLRESGQGAEELLFRPVRMEIREDGPDATKSLVGLQAEAFRKAALFAFDSSGKILLDGGVPVTKVTTTKNFSWSLPVETDLDLYILANYGELDLGSYLSSTTLRESDLEALTFRCPDSEAFAALGRSGYGIPMAGVSKGVRISSASDPIPIQTRKLFARYDFFFDTAAFTAKGYTVHSVHIVSGKANTEVPFFGEGFAQSSPSKLAPLDCGTPSDLADLDYASRGHAVTLYFLENCQGNKSGAAHWWDVASSGMSGLDLCSYIDLGIRATDPDGNDMTFFYWIYLGDDCTTNFDVRRNTCRTIRLTLKTPDEVPPTQGLAIIADRSVLSSTIPGACSLYFETTLTGDQIAVASSRSEVTASLSDFSSSSEHRVTAYPRSGHVTASTTAVYNSAVNADISARITVGRQVSGSWAASDQREVSFGAYTPTITYALSLEAPSGTSAPSDESIALKAFYDTFSDGVRTEHTDVTTHSGTTWECTSSNKSNISFPSRGTVRTTRAGTYTVKASYGGKSESIDVTFTQADYITVSDWDKTWAWDSYGSSSAQTARVRTNLPRSSLTVSCSEPEVGYALSSTAGSDGSYDLTLYWKSANSSPGSRSASVYVRGAGKSDYARMKQTGKPADEITYRLGVSPAAMSLTEGESSAAPTLYKEKYVNGSYDSRTVYSGSASWSVVSGSAYVSVNSSTGVVTAKNAGAGNATVRASVTGSDFSVRTADISVSVSKAPDVVTYRLGVSPATMSLTEGESSAAPTLYKEKYVNGSYDSRTAYSGSASWTVVSGSACVSVNSSTGVVTAKSAGAGSATVRATVTDADFSARTADISVSVSRAPDVITYRISRMSLGSASLDYGGTTTATVYRRKYVNGSPSGSEETVPASQLDWSSSATSVATVSGGTVTASSSNTGSATITATLGSSYAGDFESGHRSASATVTVSHDVVVTRSLVLSGPTSATMPGTISLSATGYTYHDGTEYSHETVTGACSWSSSSGSCTVSGGLVSAGAPGTYTVTASHPTYGPATRSVTFSRPSGFEWTSVNNQSVNEGSTITLTYETSSSSPAISWNPGVFTRVSQSTTANTGTASAYAYTGSITLRAGDVDDDTTVTVSNSISGATRTILVVAVWNIGFQWVDGSGVTVNAGESCTAAYASSSLTPSFAVSNPSIGSVSISPSSTHLNGYRYSGTATITVSSAASHNATFAVSGTAGSVTDSKSVTVNRPVVTTYAVVVTPVGASEGSHNDTFTFNAFLVRYEDGVEKSRTNVTNSARTSWKRSDYDFALVVNRNSVSSCYAGDPYHDKASGSVIATYDGPEGRYSGSHDVMFRETYNVGTTVEKELNSGKTRVRVRLSTPAPVQLYFSYGGLGYSAFPSFNNGISKGAVCSEWQLSLSQSDADDLYVSDLVTWDNKSVYYDSGNGTYYYF